MPKQHNARPESTTQGWQPRGTEPNRYGDRFLVFPFSPQNAVGPVRVGYSWQARAWLDGGREKPPEDKMFILSQISGSREYDTGWTHWHPFPSAPGAEGTDFQGAPGNMMADVKMLLGGSPEMVGVPLRDWLAGQALIGLMSHSIHDHSPLFGYGKPFARDAYIVADAMLEARRKVAP